MTALAEPVAPRLSVTVQETVRLPPTVRPDQDTFALEPEGETVVDPLVDVALQL